MALRMVPNARRLTRQRQDYAHESDQRDIIAVAPAFARKESTMATPIDAFQNWRRELDAVEQEMDRLIAAGLPASIAERQVRQTRFVALVERREAAARKLLQSDSASRRDKLPKGSFHPDAAQRGPETMPYVNRKGTPVSEVAISAPPTDSVQLGPDSAALPPVSAPSSASDQVDTAACPADFAALAPDRPTLTTISPSATAFDGDIPSGTAEQSSDAAAAVSIAVVAAEPPATTDQVTSDVAALAHDVAARSTTCVTGPAGTSNSVESVTNPAATSSETTFSEDPDASLLMLLRRLQRRG